ncbi:MAG: S8 family serine peptidase [Gemmatimonadota bacterium]
MRRIVPLGALAVAVFMTACQDSSQLVTPSASSLAPQPSLSVGQKPEGVMPGLILARLKEGADPAAMGRAHGVSLQRATPHFVVYRGAVGSERALAARMKADPSVVWAEPDYIRQPSTIDPRLWAFYNPGGLTITFTRGRTKGQVVTSYESLNDADEDNVEGYAAGGAPDTIASIDTGVDFTHPEFLAGHLIAGRDYYDNDADPTDTEGHGTHTTGTMIGQNVGVAGVSGAASNVWVIVYRVCGPLGCPTDAIVSAIYAATDAHVVAMNLSLGGSSESQAEADAIAYATSHNALVIASAGNDGTSTVSCPACDPNAISVAASNWQDGLAYYSNWGSGLDITAPGGEMYSNTTEESGIYSSIPGGYAYYQGTSMAAPQVTGTAAIVASVDGLRGSALRSRILGTTDDLGATGYDTQFGYGRLNSYRAVTNTTLSESGSGGGTTTLAASFTYSCSAADCSFDGSGSTGNVTSWDWTFGDGGTGSGPTVTHSYTAADNYTVTLTVSDGSGIDSASQTVSCAMRGKTLRCK